MYRVMLLSMQFSKALRLSKLHLSSGKDPFRPGPYR